MCASTKLFPLCMMLFYQVANRKCHLILHIEIIAFRIRIAHCIWYNDNMVAEQYRCKDRIAVA